MSHNHHHHDLHDHHHGQNKRILRLSLALIAGFMLVEVVAGWLTGSLALLSDAGHMFSDAAALALSLLAFTLGERPADSKRSYGYQRFEIIAAAINGATLLIIALWIIIEALARLYQPPTVASGAMLAVALIGLGVNLLVAWLMLRGDTHDNLNMRSAYLHVLGDILGSVGAILAALLMLLFGWRWADPLASLIIALLIGKSGYTICHHSLHILMEGTPPNINLADIIADIRRIDGILGVHHVHAWTLTSRRHALSCHIVVAKHLTIGENFALIYAVERAVQAHGIGHVTIQSEPPEHGHPEP